MLTISQVTDIGDVFSFAYVTKYVGPSLPTPTRNVVKMSFHRTFCAEYFISAVVIFLSVGNLFNLLAVSSNHHS